MPQRYLAIHDMPPGDRESAREGLDRLARAGRDAGTRPVESLVSHARGKAFTLVEAEGAPQVAEAYRAAGLPEPDVLVVERVHTELLEEPRRHRFA